MQNQAAVTPMCDFFFFSPSVPPAPQPLNQPAGRLLMNWTPVHRPAATEAATHLAPPCQDLIWDVQVVVKLFLYFCQRPLLPCELSNESSRHSRRETTHRRALASLSRSRSSGGSSTLISFFGPGFLVCCIFYFICPVIYLFGTTLKAAN